MKVAIVGSGASAAFAVWACQDVGVTPLVISDKAPSVQSSGAFFLHWLPESVRAYFPQLNVLISSQGSAEGYTRKQWGRVIPSSFPKEQRTEKWYSSEAINWLWEHFYVNVNPGKLSDESLLKLGQEHDWVFHTFPSEQSQRSRALVKFPVIDFTSPEPFNQQASRNGLDGSIVYNGIEDQPWTRSTLAFGRCSTEYARVFNGKEFDSAKIAEPFGFKVNWLRDIPPEIERVRPEEHLATNIIPLGRFAEWDRRLLSHQSYYTARFYLSGYAEMAAMIEIETAAARRGSERPDD